ncbi:hypothetical protein M8998_01620 [Sphingobacterium sp. lm-10]|uniref:hypothetical protein n=1 Tax=Sphingobacterium sp. lm-10 TaxID=2944904 RepID=UPI002021DF69|nr:hypothetical protein [Sphingobacterium sp. lm-10]MCL7986629.1 hypothetical protein [Sphingobacterium sp. lm-10]
MRDISASNKEENKPMLPDNLAEWLAQLTLLYGVPTEYLIPDPRLLPSESIRFFFLDRNWLDRLVDGALSVGVLSTKEAVFSETFFEQIYSQVDLAQLKLRSTLRNESANIATTGGTISGFIFRSQVVSGWPGLEINAYKGATPLKILRMDRLSPGVLLCLFYDMPDQVDFSEPAEGLHFGITRDIKSPDFAVSLRGLGYGNYAAGQQIIGAEAKGQLRKNGAEGVVDIAGLAASMQQELNAIKALEGELRPGGFAIQLTQGAGRQSYRIKDEKGKHYPTCTFTINSL